MSVLSIPFLFDLPVSEMCDLGASLRLGAGADNFVHLET